MLISMKVNMLLLAANAIYQQDPVYLFAQTTLLITPVFLKPSFKHPSRQA
jgi:hypothetical protein